MLNFNQSGLLVPNSIIKSNLDELYSEFVIDIPTVERKIHYDAYMTYSQALKNICYGNEITQWINGSFITKTLKPGDIDLVTFLDFKTLALLGDKINSFVYPQSEIEFKVDAYVITVYPQEDKRYIFYQSDRAYWFDKFDKTRRNKSGNKLAKGFLEITF
ncbi:hypothetical protein EON73_03820 [bacterium]|nr:MAG: hypothetical protein EON73_03820 [bacterium]